MKIIDMTPLLPRVIIVNLYDNTIFVSDVKTYDSAFKMTHDGEVAIIFSGDVSYDALFVDEVLVQLNDLCEEWQNIPPDKLLARTCVGAKVINLLYPLLKQEEGMESNVYDERYGYFKTVQVGLEEQALEIYEQFLSEKNGDPEYERPLSINALIHMARVKKFIKEAIENGRIDLKRIIFESAMSADFDEDDDEDYDDED